jgi:hypothetical protein
MEKKEFKNPIWENNTQTKIRCSILYQKGESKREARASINKFLDDDSINPDWEVIMSTHTVEDINERTSEALAEHERRDRENKLERERLEERRFQEKLFDSKLKLFQIEEIANAENIQAKSAIRKSKTTEELLLNVIKLVVQNEISKDSTKENS